MNLKIGTLVSIFFGHYLLLLVTGTDECSSYCCNSCHPTECCRKRRPDCLDFRDDGETKSGVYRIIPPDMHSGYEVYCDMTTDGGGWMLFQRRENGAVDFYRDWEDYEAGFGNVSHEHWLGFIPLMRLVYAGEYELRIDIEDFQNETRYAKYSIFGIDFTKNYTIRVQGYTGNAGDAMKPHNGRYFRTYDRDRACASRFKGGWWYRDEGCASANLNAKYYRNDTDTRGRIYWNKWHPYILKRTEMKIRRL